MELTKENFKKQFLELTEKFDIKHAFNFDEAWQTAIALRAKNSFRNKIKLLESQIKDIPEAHTEELLQESNPVEHMFAEGCYIRKIYNPANEIIITKIHAQSHPFFLMEGEMSILSEDGIQYLTAPYYGITTPGIKRVIYTHTPCVFITVHVTDLTDPEEIADTVTAETFEDPRITEEDMKLINKIKVQ
jgi:hypothetical protein